MGGEEANLVRRTLKALNALPGTRAVKNHGSPFSRVGTPDIVGCTRGLFFTLEAKSKGKHPRKIQLVELERWRRAGALALWFDSIDTAIDAVKNLRAIPPCSNPPLPRAPESPAP